MITKLLASLAGLVFIGVSVLSMAPDLVADFMPPLGITMMEGIIHLIFGILLLFGVLLAARPQTVLQILSLIYVAISIIGMDTVGQQVMELANGVAAPRWIQVALALVLVMLAFMAGSASRQVKAKEVAESAERASNAAASAASAASAATTAANNATAAATVAVRTNGRKEESAPPANALGGIGADKPPAAASPPTRPEARESRPPNVGAKPQAERVERAANKEPSKGSSVPERGIRPLADRLDPAQNKSTDSSPAKAGAPDKKPESDKKLEGKEERGDKPSASFSKSKEKEPETQS